MLDQSKEPLQVEAPSQSGDGPKAQVGEKLQAVSDQNDKQEARKPSGSLISGKEPSPSGDGPKVEVGEKLQELLTASVLRPSKTFDQEAAEALRKYARKNRPPGFERKFLTQGCQPMPVVISASTKTAPVDNTSTVCPPESTVLPKLKETSDVIAESSVEAPGDSVETKLPQLLPEVAEVLAPDAVAQSNVAPQLRKFDIFDNIDEERLREFTEKVENSKMASNYDEFMKKSRKVDPNKFATSACVEQKESGHIVLT